MTRMAPLVLLVAFAACNAHQSRTSDHASAAAEQQRQEKLVTSLEVEVGQNAARMVLRVTNPSAQPVVLEFASGQRYDFAVRTAAGAEIWRWSADRMFTQATGALTVAPGATMEFSEQWVFGNRKGSFVALAELKATNATVRESAPFEIR